MRIVKTIKEYQKCIDEVKKTKHSIRVTTDLSEDEFKKRQELNTAGVEIIVRELCDEINFK